MEDRPSGHGCQTAVHRCGKARLGALVLRLNFRRPGTIARNPPVPSPGGLRDAAGVSLWAPSMREHRRVHPLDRRSAARREPQSRPVVAPPRRGRGRSRCPGADTASRSRSMAIRGSCGTPSSPRFCRSTYSRMAFARPPGAVSPKRDALPTTSWPYSVTAPSPRPNATPARPTEQAYRRARSQSWRGGRRTNLPKPHREGFGIVPKVRGKAMTCKSRWRSQGESNPCFRRERGVSGGKSDVGEHWRTD